MKNKVQSDLSEQPNKYALPPPLQLAKLAALLDGPDQLCRNAPEAAVVVAARFFLKVVECHEHFASLKPDDLLILLSATELPTKPELRFDDGILEIYNRRKAEREARRLYSDHAKPTADERERYFEGGLDEVRSYLTEHADIFDWKTTQAVLDNILRYFKDLAREHNNKNESAIAAYQEEFEKQYEASLRKFAESESIEVSAVSEANKTKVRKWVSRTMRPHEDQKKQTGKEQFRTYLRTYAIRNPSSPCGYAYDPTSPKHIIYWELPVSYLDTLIAWRRVVAKRPGGAKSLDVLE